VTSENSRLCYPEELQILVQVGTSWGLAQNYKCFHDKNYYWWFAVFQVTKD